MAVGLLVGQCNIGTCTVDLVLTGSRAVSLRRYSGRRPVRWATGGPGWSGVSPPRPDPEPGPSPEPGGPTQYIYIYTVVFKITAVCLKKWVKLKILIIALLYKLKNAWRFSFPIQLIFSCITTVSENCLTSVLHGVDQLLAPVNRYFRPGRLDYIPQFLCISWFCLRNSIFDVTPQVFYWIKVRGLGWPLHNVNLVGLEPRCCSLTGVFGVVVLLRNTFQGHFLFGIRQHDLFKYFDVFKLIHDPWYAINRPDTIVWETSPYHDACATMLHCLHSVLWLEFSVWGSSDKLSAAPRPKKNNLAFISPENVAPFLFRPVNVFFGKFLPFSQMCIRRTWGEIMREIMS